MIRIIYYFIFCLGFVSICQAQKPQFANKIITPVQHGGGLGFLPYSVSDSLRGRKLQIIYHPSEFVGAPAGKMVNIYVRFYGGGVPGADTLETTYPKFTVKMGYTEKTAWKPSSTPRDTFATGLNTVHYNPLWKRKWYADTLGSWVRIPINAGDFRFDLNKRFIVEYSSAPSKNGILIGAHVATPATRSLAGFADSAWGGGFAADPDFGFDLAPTSVEQLTGLTALGLFPNPAPGGRVNLTFESNQFIKSSAIHILDVAGRVVWAQQHAGVGTSFFKELDLKSLPPGQYILNLILDGACVSRKLVIQ